jgi:hypothetical protein
VLDHFSNLCVFCKGGYASGAGRIPCEGNVFEWEYAPMFPAIGDSAWDSDGRLRALF